MLTSDEREKFALIVMEEVRRWPGVEMRPHPSHIDRSEVDGVEFRLCGRQIGHVHGDCAVHLSLTKALKEFVVGEQLAQPLVSSPASAWAMYSPMITADAAHAIWLLRLNYVRLRRQRLTPTAAAASELIQKHEAALGAVSTGVSQVLQRTQVRSQPRPLPALEA